jgi:hypothetical protein
MILIKAADLRPWPSCQPDLSPWKAVAMSIRSRLVAAIIALSTTVTAVPIFAQHEPQAHGDSREPVILAPFEAEAMLAGMREYLETIQGIVAALAENDTMRSADIAANSGARMLESVPFTTGLKVPLGFTTMSLDTHDKFDKLADKMRRGTSRTEVLSDLRNIMSNCISCHASYRMAP